MLDTEQLRDLVIDALEDIKAIDIRVLDVRGKSSVTDIMVIASGNTARQVKALTDNVVVKAKESGSKPLGVEGEALTGSRASAERDRFPVRWTLCPWSALSLERLHERVGPVMNCVPLHHSTHGPHVLLGIPGCEGQRAMHGLGQPIDIVRIHQLGVV